jgi:hypothetical protein
MLRDTGGKINRNCPYTVSMRHIRRNVHSTLTSLPFSYRWHPRIELSRDYQSMDEILDSVEVGTCNEPEEKEIITIFFKKDVLDVPIFRPWDEQAIEDSTGRARGADAFGKELLLNIISRPNK